jgi:hypothetical protein
MTDRLLIALVCGLIGWNGLFPAPPTPASLREKMIESQHAKVCEKKKLRTKIKKLCRKWGYDR